MREAVGEKAAAKRGFLLPLFIRNEHLSTQTFIE